MDSRSLLSSFLLVPLAFLVFRSLLPQKLFHLLVNVLIHVGCAFCCCCCPAYFVAAECCVSISKYSFWMAAEHERSQRDTEAKKQFIHKVGCVLVWEYVHHVSPQYRIVATNQINKIAFYVCICAQLTHTKWLCVLVMVARSGNGDGDARATHIRKRCGVKTGQREIPVHRAHKDNKNDKQKERQQMKRN